MELAITLFVEKANKKYRIYIKIPNGLALKNVVAIEEEAPVCVNVMSTTESSVTECVEYIKLENNKIARIVTTYCYYRGAPAGKYEELKEYYVEVEELKEVNEEEFAWVEWEKKETLLRHLLLGIESEVEEDLRYDLELIANCF